MKTAWDMTAEEREALWAKNDAEYAKVNPEDEWAAEEADYEDWVAERRAIEGPIEWF